MKIMYVATCLGSGGAQIQVCSLADKMTQKGHKVIVISLRNEVKIRPSENVQVIALNLEKNISSLTKTITSLRKILKEFQPDVVHSHMIHANLLMRIVRIFTNLNFLVCTAHSSNEGSNKMMLLYRITDFLANLTTNVSMEAVQVYLKKKASTKNKMVCVYNGIDTKKYRNTSENYFHKKFGLESNAKILLAIGRLTEAKDYPNLLKAFEKIKHSKVYLFIVGDGELEFYLKELANKNIKKDQIFFMGVQNNIPQLLSSCDTFVLSSKWEGFGLVVAEALACKCNVVATNCGGVKEVLGGYGFLVEKMNSKQLATALEESLNLTKNSNDIGREHIVKNFDLDSIARKWEIIYSSSTNN